MNPPVVSHFLRNASENTVNSARRGTVSSGSCISACDRRHRQQGAQAGAKAYGSLRAIPVSDRALLLHHDGIAELAYLALPWQTVQEAMPRPLCPKRNLGAFSARNERANSSPECRCRLPEKSVLPPATHNDASLPA